MTTLRLVLGDQLTRNASVLADAVPGVDVVLLAEVEAETGYVAHHKQKIVLVLSAMRKFARALEAEGFAVRHVRLEDEGNTGNLAGELDRAVVHLQPDRVILMEPGEHRVLKALNDWAAGSGLPVEMREDDRFFVSRSSFERWAKGRRTLRMEHFYREVRRATGVLMTDGSPTGGRWNFDADNRDPPPAASGAPPVLRFAPDAVTLEVMELVARRFPQHFGSLDAFGWATTREEALEALEAFVANGLPGFGRWQDAMLTGEVFLHHSALSAYINIGLLTPREVVGRVERAFGEGSAPIQSAEGFIRQILGWREFVRGFYWKMGPDYSKSNALGAYESLPDFYWTGRTSMACIADAVEATRRHAYAHHIVRLMVLGNFALLWGVKPEEIEEWFLIVYADAFEWVELPNVHGMAVFADGGALASKPYAASGAYIDRMSDHCRSCRFHPSKRTGGDACPFTSLYWDFLSRHRERLGANPRMALPLKALDRMDAGELAAIRDRVADLRRDPARLAASPGLFDAGAMPGPAARLRPPAPP